MTAPQQPRQPSPAAAPSGAVPPPNGHAPKPAAAVNGPVRPNGAAPGPVPANTELSPAKQGKPEVEWMVAELAKREYGVAATAEMAVKFHRDSGGKYSFTQVLIDLGVVTPINAARLVAGYWGLPYVDRLDVDGDVWKSIPPAVARSRYALPLARVGGTGSKTVRVAIADPMVTNFSQVQYALAEKGYVPQFVIAAPADIIAKIDSLNAVRATVGGSDTDGAAFVEQVIKDAFEAGASDVHFIPMETSLSIEFRIDGIMIPNRVVANDRKMFVLNGVKVAANRKRGGEAVTSGSNIIDIANTRIPQDAAGTRMYGSSRVNLRFSTLPTIYGESIVVRILDQSKGMVPIEKLGMSRDMFAQLMPVLQGATGSILTTGPTGSGKTTSMYSMLGATNWKARGMSLFTLENPVEYEMGNGARQTEVTEQMTWSRGLRAILRQDPDIVLVGEIRDSETAENLIAAAMTGHLVFSTLHTNTAVQCFARLMGLGVDPGAICAAVKLIIAQRLVRRLCPKCRRPHPRSGLLARQYGDLLAKHGIEAAQFFEGGPGCPACKSAGFHGQIGIYNTLPVWPFEELVVQRKCDAMPHEYDDVIARYNAQCLEVRQMRAKAGAQDIEAQIVKQFGEKMQNAAPILSLREDGIIKAAQGITTPEEVWSVT